MKYVKRLMSALLAVSAAALPVVGEASTTATNVPRTRSIRRF